MHSLHYNHLFYLINCVYCRNELPGIEENEYETITFTGNETEVLYN